MCLMCDDEAAYKAYMDYLDAMQRQGKDADPNKAVEAVLDAMQTADLTARADAPENDRTLSPFFCSPVHK